MADSFFVSSPASVVPADADHPRKLTIGNGGPVYYRSGDSAVTGSDPVLVSPTTITTPTWLLSLNGARVFSEATSPITYSSVPSGFISSVYAHGVSLSIGLSAHENHGYNRRLAARLNAAITNNSTGSSKAMWNDPGNNTNCGYSRILQDIGGQGATNKALSNSAGSSQNLRPFLPWAIGTNVLGVINLGYADFYNLTNSGDSDNALAALPRYLMGMRVILSRYRAAYIWEDGVASVSLVGASGSGTGSWVSSGASTDKNSGTRYSQTTANGDYIEFHTTLTNGNDLPPGATVDVGGLVLSGKSSTVTINVDGVQAATFDVGQYAPQAAGKYNGWIYRLPVSAAGPVTPYVDHTIRATFTAITGGAGAALFDYAQVESPLPCPILVISLVRPPSTAVYFGSSVANRDDITRTANASLRALVDEINAPSPVPSAIYVDVDTAFNKDPTYWTPLAGTDGAGDNLHWNDVGHGLAADLCYQALASWYSRVYPATSLATSLVA